MTAKTRKELALLGALALVLAVAVYWNLAAKPAEAPPAPSNSSASAKPKAVKTEAAQTVTDVNLELLTPEPDTYGAATRDPFRFKPKPSPVIRQPAPAVVIAAPAPPPPTPPRPQGPSIESMIRYWGYSVSSTGRSIAMLSYGPVNTQAIQVLGSEGDIIEGRYRLQRIEPNAIEVIELNGNRRARIPRL